MQIYLAGRLRYTSLPITSGLLPLFEAVVNSIHGIEESGAASDHGKISVEVLCKKKQNLLDLNDSKKKKGPDAHEDIVGFKITDNGVGFNDENMESFQTLDSDHKAAKGCPGVGRLLWPKAFNSVRVVSTFKTRKFNFNKPGASKEVVKDVATGATCETIVYLDDFAPRYGVAQLRLLADRQ